MEGSLLLHACLSAAALALSGYAFYVARSGERDGDFEAMCDVGPRMSCSHVLTSKYSKGFGLLGDLLGEKHVLNVNNSLYGIAFYSTIAFLGFLRSRTALILMIIGEVMGVANLLYLGYIMFYILNNVCLVCVTLDSVHLLLLAVHLYQYCSWRGKRKKKAE